MKSISCALVALACISTTGCAAWISSTSLDSQAESEGLTYYLPMRLARVTFERVRTKKVEDAATELGVARTQLGQASATLDEERAKYELIVREIERLQQSGIAANSATMTEATIRKAKAGAIVDTKAAAVQDATATIEAKLLAYNTALAATPECLFADRVLISLLSPVADTSQRYALKDSHSWTRSESLELTTTRSGLLTGAIGEATDQTAEALLALVQAAAMRATDTQVRFAKPGITENCEKVVPLRFEKVLDPSSSADLLKFSMAVNAVAATGPFRDRYYRLSRESLLPPVQRTSKAGMGIVYRRELPLVVSVYAGTKDEIDSGGGSPQSSFMLEVPNDAPPDVLPMRLGTFGRSNATLAFDNGMLLTSDMVRSSELARAAKLPFEALKAAVAAPAEIIQLRIDKRSREAELLDKDKALLEAQQALEEAQRALEESRITTEPAS